MEHYLLLVSFIIYKLDITLCGRGIFELRMCVYSIIQCNYLTREPMLCGSQRPVHPPKTYERGKPHPKKTIHALSMSLPHEKRFPLLTLQPPEINSADSS